MTSILPTSLKLKLIKNPWTEEEDEKLLRFLDGNESQEVKW
jgi:hypothetical protein